MTHDELLAAVEELDFWLGQKTGDKAVDALRAVVELHKPKETKTDLQVCNYCRDIDDWKEVSFVWYPCPTIQAIKKELS